MQLSNSLDCYYIHEYFLKKKPYSEYLFITTTGVKLNILNLLLHVQSTPKPDDHTVPVLPHFGAKTQAEKIPKE